MVAVEKGEKMPKLIDADVLAESTCYGICAECDEMYKGKNVMTNCSEIRLMFLRLINHAPTVNPVKHGRWLKSGQSFIFPNEFLNYFCSECGYELDKSIRTKFNYCPNCGSKMDEVAE